MANFHIGLDFGTSQTKVCVLNKESRVREFIKFQNDKYFLPSLIVKKADGTFSYGDENITGIKYRYFKMAAAEDEDLIQVTNEDLEGNLPYGTTDDFRKYSTDYQVKPEILVVIYLTYVYLYIKKLKNQSSIHQAGGLLGRLIGNQTKTENSFSINLGIPTEWNNPNHFKRKIKFQSLLLISFKLANEFESLDSFLLSKDFDIFARISKINEKLSFELLRKDEIERSHWVTELLINNKLSVLAESAAGVNYLLETRRLKNGFYATLDIGAGTSDVAIFQVIRNKLSRYFCSESISLASNDIYREYAKQHFNKEIVSFEEIKISENLIRYIHKFNRDFYINSVRIVRGFLDRNGLEFVIGKSLYRQYYLPYRNINAQVQNIFNELNRRPIIIFGGGANLEGFSEGEYSFYQGNNPFGHHDKNFVAIPITNYINHVDIVDYSHVQNQINLLVVSLGLTYGEQTINNNFIPFFIPPVVPLVPDHDQVIDRYFYYDLQEAAYK